MVFRSVALHRTWFCILAVLFSSWFVHKLYVDATFRTLFYFVPASIMLMLLLPITIFGARVLPKNDGLHVEQYRSAILPYADVIRCIGFFFFPIQAVVVITTHRFPLKILISGDTLHGKRKSILQDGELAKSIRARMNQENNGVSLGRVARGR